MSRICADLSPRERDIVEMVGRDGMLWPDVDASLGIHRSTRRTYVQRILSKFDSTRPPREALVEIYYRCVVPQHDAPEHVVPEAD